MKSIVSVCAMLTLATALAGCSVVMEATRPTPTDLNSFQVGMTRDQVLEKLGAPDTTALGPDGASCDFYKLYTRGYGAAGKVPIAVAEAAADVFTVGLAEIVLTPTEGVTRNAKHPVQFCYRGQQLARIVTDVPANAASDQNPTIAPGQNPPITAASNDRPAVEPITALSPIATPGASPTSAASAPAQPKNSAPTLPE